jgi:hypothetical protein
VRLNTVETFEHTLATYVYNHRNMCKIYTCNVRFQRNVTLLLERIEVVVAELNAGVEVGGGTWSLPVQQRCGQLASGATSHEAPPIACLLEHPLWTLAGSVEAAAASG